MFLPETSDVFIQNTGCFFKFCRIFRHDYVLKILKFSPRTAYFLLLRHFAGFEFSEVALKYSAQNRARLKTKQAEIRAKRAIYGNFISVSGFSVLPFFLTSK